MTLAKIGIFHDPHFGYEDKYVWSCFLQSMDLWKPDVLVCVGDVADNASINPHGYDPRAKPLSKEIECTKDRLRDVKRIGAKRRILALGNHDIWLTRYIKKNAPALIDTHPTLPELWEAERMGFEVYEYGEMVRMGKLHFVHDLGASGANAVRAASKCINESLVIGHIHRMETLYTGNMLTGEKHVTASFGWMGDPKHAAYATKAQKNRDWMHGFGIAYGELETGYVHMHGIPVFDRRCVIEGKLVRA